MKRAGRLFTRVCALDNLMYSSKRAAKGVKKYRSRISCFLFNQEKELLQIQHELGTKTYLPRPYTQFTIYDPKKRTISVADFRDRVVYHALCNIIGPILDKTLVHHSYACRKNKGMHQALQQSKLWVKKNRYFLKLDIRKYFESISHVRLKQLLARKIKDQDVLWLINTIIDHVPPTYRSGCGLPIGNLTSQHFANYYLSSLDHYIKETLHIKEYLRYMDDMLFLSNDKMQLWDCFQEIRLHLQEILELTVNEKSSVLAPVTQGMPFLGFKIYPNRTWVQKSKWRRFKKKLLKRQSEYARGQIDKEYLTQSVAGMLDFLSYGDTYVLRKNFIDRYAIEV